MFLNLNKLLFLILIINKFAFSQTLTSSQDTITKPNSSSFVTGYNKVLNVHSFNSTLNTNYSFNGVDFDITNRFNSIIIFSTIKSIRDENYFNSKIGYTLFKFLKPAISLESKRINDNRKIGISRFKDLSLKGWIRLNPFSTLKLAPYYGYKAEEYFEKYEEGKSLGLVTTFEETFSKSQFTGNLRLVNDYLSVRNNQLINSDILFESLLSDFLLTSTKFYFNKISRDYFTTIDSITGELFNTDLNIENRTDNVFDFSQRFKLINIENFAVNLSGNFYYRNVDKNTRYKNLNNPSKNLFDTKVNEFRFNIFSELHFNYGKWTNIFIINYNERSEKHSVKRLPNIPEYLYYQRLDEELQKNNYSSRVILGSRNKLNTFKKDTLFLELSISKLRYDTPPLESYVNPAYISRDDRDELLYIIKFQYLKLFSHRLSSLFLLESFNNHLVYIFKEKSSNNNWNRVLRLGILNNYSSSKFSSKNHFEVLANYTVYDFEDLFQGSQSFAFRQFVFYDSTKFYLFNNFFAEINFNLRLSEQGIFNWKKFSSLPGRFLNEKLGEIKLGYELSKINFISTGLRYTSLIEYNFKGKEKNIVLEMNSFGPLIEFFLYYRVDFYLNLKCWIEYINQTNQQQKRNINLSFNSYMFF